MQEIGHSRKTYRLPILRDGMRIELGGTFSIGIACDDRSFSCDPFAEHKDKS